MKSGNLARLFTLFLLAGLSLSAMATSRTWPGSAPCNGTLQSCINSAADGDYITIATDGPINEQLTLEDRSLTLRAANGFHPRLSSTYGISVFTSSSTGDLTIRLDGITLTNGGISMSYSGVGTGTYEVKNSTASKINVKAYSGTLNASVYNNRLIGTPVGGINSSMLSVKSEYATLSADVYFNHVSSLSADTVGGAGILVDVRNRSTGEVKLLGNTVRGNFGRAAISVSEGLLANTTSDLSAFVYNNVVVCNGSTSSIGGIAFLVKDGSMTTQAINNTVSGCYTGIHASRWYDGTSGSSVSMDGIVSSNLVVGAELGLQLNQPVASGVTNDYNLINATQNANVGLILGSHTITAPAKLVSSGIPRLSAASPAVDAGDTATLGIGLLANGMPALDADGLRRFKGPGSSGADIGAYEYGDLGFMHNVSASSTSHISTIFNPITDGDSSLNLFATPNFNVGDTVPAVTNNHAFGSWYDGSHWTLFQEDTSVKMPANAHFNVFMPGKGGGVFRHVATAGNTSAWSTWLDDSSVNGKSDRIILVNQNYTAGAQYNDHPVGVFYYGGGSGRWYISNLDQLDSGGDMPLGAGFSVYAQQPSPNAFRAVQSSNSNTLVLDHPLLNETPCAQVAVTRMLGSQPAGGNFDADFNPYTKRWEIFSYAGQIATGDQFNVVVNPGQVELCSDVIFANGFE